MRVLFVADPAPLGRPGALQGQVRETMAAFAGLRGELGVDVVLGAPGAARPPGCDLVHVFGAAGGNGAAVHNAAAAGVPVVLSPRLSPSWNRANGSRARVADRVFGNRSACDIDSGYAQVRRALQAASRLVAQDEAERKAICDAFLVAADKVEVVGHGIAARFFAAEPGPFRERVRIAGRFALMAGRVSPYSGQLGVARALAELALPLVVIGDARERDARYLRELRAMRTVTCTGAFDHGDALLASACAAASVFVAAGRGPVQPMALAEALAAGAPVVSPAPCWPGLADAGFALRHAPCGDGAALKQAVSDLLERPPAREAVRALVRPFTWQAAARRLAQCYSALLAAR